MAEQRVPNQWQLEDTGESLDQWKLQDDEQRLPSHMQLQDQYENPEMMDAAWQPIDYRAMQAAATGKSRRGGTALGALLVVALLGVAGYLAWFYMEQPNLLAFLNGGDTPAATADTSRDPAEAIDMAAAASAAITETAALDSDAPAAADVPAAAEAAPAAAPAAVVVADTTAEAAPVATAAPVLPVTAEVRQAVVNSQFGVNMRATAAATGALLATLDDKSTHVVASGPTTDAAGASWYELALPDKARGWVSADYITVTVQNLPYADAAALLATVGLALPAPAASVAAEPASTNVTTTTEAVVDAAPAAPADEVAVRLSAVTAAPGGLNLRRAPELGDNVIVQVADATAVTVIGRSADGAWLQLEMADKTRGWASTDFVTVTGNVNTIPAGTSYPLTDTGAALLPTPTAVAASAVVEPGVAATPDPAATPAPAGPVAVGATSPFTVTGIMGVNVRAEPSNDVPGIVQLSWNTSGDATGRTADSNWVQVTIPSGQSGWVAASAVTVAGGVEALPVTN